MRENTRLINRGFQKTVAWTQAGVAQTSGSGRYTAAQHDIAMDRLLEDLIAMGDAETSDIASGREPKLRLTAPMTQADLLRTDLTAETSGRIACHA